jgi:hypothetical protein
VTTGLVWGEVSAATHVVAPCLRIVSQSRRVEGRRGRFGEIYGKSDARSGFPTNSDLYAHTGNMKLGKVPRARAGAGFSTAVTQLLADAN